MEAMKLYVYKGLHNIPSIDFECLRSMAYVQMISSNVGLMIAESNPFNSPNTFLPYVQDDKIKIAGYENILKYCNECFPNNRLSSSPQEALSTAYMEFLKSNLHPCIQYYLWGDAHTAENTRIMYAKRTPFPFNFWYPQKYIKKCDELMQLCEQFSINDKIENHQTENMLLNARKSLNMIESKIGTKSSLLSSGYTEVDATLYAYITVILYVLPENSPLRLHINECPNLLRFAQSVQETFLSPKKCVTYANKDEELKLAGSIATATAELDDDKMFSRKMPLIISSSIAIGAMVLFAIKQNLFSLNGDVMDRYQTGYDDDDEDIGDDE